MASLAAVGGLMIGVLPRCSRPTRLSCHFYQNFSGLRRTVYLPQECDAGNHACHLKFSSEFEIRDGRTKSLPLPATRFQQIPGPAALAHLGDRYSRVGLTGSLHVRPRTDEKLGMPRCRKSD